MGIGVGSGGDGNLLELSACVVVQLVYNGD